MATTKTNATQTPSFLTALAAATKEDLTEIRQQIESKAAELSSLKEVEKLLAAKFGETPVAKMRKAKLTKAAGASDGSDEGSDEGRGGSELANQIFDTIHQFGPQTCGELAEHLSVGVAAIGRSASSSGWFEKDGDGKLHIKKAE